MRRLAEVARLHADGTVDVAHANVLTGDPGHGVHQLVDRDVLGVADVGRLVDVGAGQRQDAVDEVVDVRVGANGRAIAPDLDLAAVGHSATLRQMAAGAFSRPPSHVPYGP